MGSPSRRGPHVGASFMRAFRKPVHESSKTPVLGLKLLHLEQSRRGQAAIALAPPIKRGGRDVRRSSNFGNGDTRIGFVPEGTELRCQYAGSVASAVCFDVSSGE